MWTATTHGQSAVPLRVQARRKKAPLRCYAPSTSVIAALLFVGYLTLRQTAGHALAGVGGAGPATTLVIVLGCCLLAAGLAVVCAATIRRRRAAAGGCLTCRHPCQEALTPQSAGRIARVSLAARGGPPAPRGPNPASAPGNDKDALPAPGWPNQPLTRAHREAPAPQAARLPVVARLPMVARQSKAAPVAVTTSAPACQDRPLTPSPAWPDRPLTSAALPLVALPRQRPASDAAQKQPASDETAQRGAGQHRPDDGSRDHPASDVALNRSRAPSVSVPPVPASARPTVQHHL